MSLSTAAHGAVSPTIVESQAGSGINGGLLYSQNGQAGANTNRPRAFINYILFDEQFKYVGGGTSIVGGAGEFKKHQNDPQLQNISVPKNGYIYVYCSNESNINVFFDNLQVVHTRGAIFEETSYYPFGLTMVGISSKAAGKLENKNKFNNIEQNSDLDLNTFEAFYRTNDPQTGRWWQIDPKGESFYSLTPYNSMGNNPIIFNDPLGDIFDKDSEGYLDKAKERIKERQQELRAEKQRVKKEMVAAKKSGDKDLFKSQKNQLKELNTMSSELTNASHEIDIMEKSDQLFTIRAFDKGTPGFVGNAEGVTTYSLNDKAIAIAFDIGNIDVLLHELAHGFDFLQGNISYNVNPMNIEKKEDYFKSVRRSGALYDVNDEVRAYRRNYSLNPTLWNAFSNFSEINKNQLSKVYKSLACENLNVKNTALPKNEIVYKTHKN